MSKNTARPPVSSGKQSLKQCWKRHPALWLLFLLPLMTACSTTTTKFVKVRPTPIPASLLIECVPAAPPSDPLTYGASVLWNELLLTDLQNCNHQIDGIRQLDLIQTK